MVQPYLGDYGAALLCVTMVCDYGAALLRPTLLTLLGNGAALLFQTAVLLSLPQTPVFCFPDSPETSRISATPSPSALGLPARRREPRRVGPVDNSIFHLHLAKICSVGEFFSLCEMFALCFN